MSHKLSRLLSFFLILLFGGALLQACTRETESVVTVTPPSTPLPAATATTAAAMAVPLTLEALITRLQEAGLQVAVGESFPGHIFSVAVQTLRVNGGSVLVYEYPDLDTAVTEAGWIRANGYEFHFPDPENPGQMIAMIVEPTGTPHYFRLDNLLVNYTGDDLEIMAGLAQVLGPQFIGGPLPMPTPTAVPSPSAAGTSNTEVTPPEITQLAQLGNGRIDSITWLPDGKTFAVGSSNGVDYFDGQTLQPTYSIRDSQISGSVHINISPTGEFLIITMGGSETDRVTLWNSTSGEFVRDLYDAFFPQFSPDGQIVYFDWATQQLIWHDPASGETRQSLPLTFSPRAFNLAGGMLVELTFDNVLNLYSLDDLALQHMLALPDIIDDVAFSPQGDLLAAASRDGFIRLWEVESGTMRHTLEGLPGWVSSVQFSPDGRTLASWVSGAEAIRLWDTVTGMLQHELPVEPGCTSGGIFAFSPDVQELATVSGGKIHFYDLATGSLKNSLDNEYCFAADLAFGPDTGSLLAAGNNQIYRITLPDADKQSIYSTETSLATMAISPDGDLIALGSGTEATVQLWDGDFNHLLFTLEAEGKPISSLRFSPDGRLLAARSGFADSAVVHVWRVDDGELLESFNVHTSAFSPDGRTLALSLFPSGGQPAIALWDTESRQQVNRLENLELVGFSPEGNLLALQRDGQAQSNLSWWRVDQGEQLRPYISSEGPSNILAYSPDGRLLLGFDNIMGTLGIWDAASEQRVWSGWFAQTAAFSLDGQFLAVVTHDGNVTLWRVE